MANKTLKIAIRKIKRKTKKGKPKSLLLQKLTNQTKFDFMEKIGKGNYSNVYLVKNKQNGKKTALKLEKITDGNGNLLMNEATILQNLHLNGCKVIPVIDWFGKIGTTYRGLSMTYFEATLIDIHFANDNEIIEIFDEMLDVLDEVHYRGVVHCDIKPQNFMFDGNGNVRLIDFGMSRFFVDGNKKFLPLEKITSSNDEKILYGTTNYASIWMHQKMMPYPRDDICSLVFVLFYLLNGKKKLWKTQESILTQKKQLLKNIDENLAIKYPWMQDIIHWDYTDGINRDVFLTS
jgi:serine/threonine protein kinase